MPRDWVSKVSLWKINTHKNRIKTVCSIQPLLLLFNDNYLPIIEASNDKVMNYENVLKELNKIDCKFKCH